MTARFQISGLFQHYQDPDRHEAGLGTSPLQAKRLITPQQRLFIARGKSLTSVSRADEVVLFRPQTRHNFNTVNVHLFNDDLVDFGCSAQNHKKKLCSGEGWPVPVVREHKTDWTKSSFRRLSVGPLSGLSVLSVQTSSHYLLTLQKTCDVKEGKSSRTELTVRGNGNDETFVA